jgi:hypothetical protein
MQYRSRPIQAHLGLDRNRLIHAIIAGHRLRPHAMLQAAEIRSIVATSADERKSPEPDREPRMVGHATMALPGAPPVAAGREERRGEA